MLEHWKKISAELNAIKPRLIIPKKPSLGSHLLTPLKWLSDGSQRVKGKEAARNTLERTAKAELMSLNLN